MPELVSILIPAYNAEQWIGPAITSCLRQTWPNTEVIIVDDGSMDGTRTVARRFESKSVKVVKQENRGASAARNRALSLAQGDYIQWLDADDLLHPEKISRQMGSGDCRANPRLLLSSAWGSFSVSPERAVFVPGPLWEDLEPAEWLFRKLYHNAWMSPQSWLASRRLTDLTGPWDERLSLDDDGEYFCRMVVASEAIRFVADAKSYKRTGNVASLSSDINLSDRKKESQFLSMCRHIEHLRSLEDTPRTREACVRYLQRWLIYFYPDHTAILEQASSLARSLGGELHPPRLKAAYRLVQALFGWNAAKQAQGFVKKTKRRAATGWNTVLGLLSRGQL